MIRIQDDIWQLHCLGVLDQLLMDRTTGKHIVWAADAYGYLGSRFRRDSEIEAELITGQNADVIRTRARKATEQQSARTRQHAEVFTPLWIVRDMNDLADERWFGYPNVFFKDGVPTEHVRFSPAGKTWQAYVDARRLEITCGEAPYLMSRYDAETGETIPIPDRAGILDRKLRVVNENTETEGEWLTWATRAVEATYGYEFQGDNTLIARVNLVMTYAEYLWERWRRKPTEREYQRLVNIISWNLWQMDGLTGTVPFGTAEDTPRPLCRIYDWRLDQCAVFNALLENGGREIAFDVLIGNPPYQEADGGSGASARPIYNKFIQAAKKLSPEVLSLIIPAKWYSGGKGLDEFRRDMLSDPRISRLVDYTDSTDCFPGVDVAGGVCYFVWDKGFHGDCLYTNHYRGVATTVERDLGAYSTLIRYPVAVTVIEKVKALHEVTLDTVVSSRKPFGLNTKARPTATGDITLRYNGGTGPYHRSEIKVGADLIDKWKIIISYLTAEHAGQPAKNGQFRILSTMEKLAPKTVCSETYLVAGAFDTQAEADHFMAYLKTRFARFLIAQIAVTQHVSRATFAFVPVQDFTRPITDGALYRKYQLSGKEIEFIEQMIKKMD